MVSKKSKKNNKNKKINKKKKRQRNKEDKINKNSKKGISIKEISRLRAKTPKIIIKVAILFIISLVLQFYFLNPIVVLAYNLSFMVFSLLLLRNVEILYFIIGIILMFLMKIDPFSVFFYLISIFMSLMFEFKRHFDSFLNFILTQIIMISFFTSLIFLQIITYQKTFFYISELITYGIIMPSIIFLFMFTIMNFFILSPRKSKDKSKDEFYLLTKFFLKFSLKSLTTVVIFSVVIYFVFITYYSNILYKNMNHMALSLEKIENELNNSVKFNLSQKQYVLSEKDLISVLNQYQELSIKTLKASIEYARLKHRCINMTFSNESITYDSELFRVIKALFTKVYISQYAKTIKKSTIEILSPYLCKEQK